MNDGRQYAFLMNNAGRVIFSADGRYLSHKHDFHIHKAIQTCVNQLHEDRKRNHVASNID
jgi:hypothetical protein